MWTLKKPTLESAKADIPYLIENSTKLVESDKASIEALYDQYDTKRGSITNNDQESIPKGTREELYSLYSKTYNAGPLSFIRSSLLDGVNKCPYCSISEPNTLDHYLPKSNYKALSVCRLNLVPMCGNCNLKKRDNAHEGYIHPYYFTGPGVSEFLVVKITVTEDLNLAVDLTISSKVTDDNKRSVLENQIKCLDLNTRISHEMNDFLGSLFEQSFVSNEHLHQFLLMSKDRVEEMYRANDWRTALLRGLIDCSEFTFEVANNICHQRSTLINNGAGI